MKARVVCCKLVISRRDATAVLDLIEEPLDQIAATMEIRAKADRRRAVPPKLLAWTYGGHRRIDANDPEQTCCSSGKTLDERQILMASRVIADTADHFKAELLVEAGRLEVVGLQHNLLAAPRFGFLLYRAH
jgi:hypothetical protein